MHTMIVEWISNSKHIIVMIDANNDISVGHNSTCYDNMISAGLSETILSQHQYLAAPATRARVQKP